MNERDENMTHAEWFASLTEAQRAKMLKEQRAAEDFHRKYGCKEERHMV